MKFKEKENKILRMAISAILASYSMDSLSDPQIVVNSITTNSNPTQPSLSQGGKTATINIDESGIRSGSNAFLSFKTLNVPDNNDKLIFSCSGNNCFTDDPGSTISNIIGRIYDSTLGAQTSTINGGVTIDSIPNLNQANLWLFNPEGMVIGSHAALNVPGAFHVSNATGISFEGENNPKFDLATDNVNSLTVAPPSQFLFNAVTVGANTTVSSTGNINITSAGITVPGDIEISASSDTDVKFSGTSTLTSTGSGTISLSGGNLIVATASITNATADNSVTIKTEGEANILAGSDLRLGSSVLGFTNSIGKISRTQITSNTPVNGDLNITTGTLSFNGPLSIGTSSITDTTSNGSGDLTIKVNNDNLAVTSSNLSKSTGQDISGKLNVEVSGSLDNSAAISGYATAGTNLTNTGTIGSANAPTSA
ncbi:MAG: two-partner secretion domain-containing protein, partial [Gammaproteobacteria bacterium]